MSQKRARAWWEGICIAGIGFVLLPLWLICRSASPASSLNQPLTIILDCLGLVALLLIACGLTDALKALPPPK